MFIKSEKEQKYVKKMIEVDRIKRKRAGLLRKEQSAVRAAKRTQTAS